MIEFGLTDLPYELFTLKHNPDKTNPNYFKQMLEHLNLKASELVYFEHNQEAVKSAKSLGINSYHYDSKKRDLIGLKHFLDNYLQLPKKG